MTDIKNLLDKIIPPADYQHRNGFTSNYIIDKLSADDKIKIEAELLKALQTSDDTLIGETLAYMKSLNAVHLIRHKLNLSKSPATKILWASYIYIISPEETEMQDIAFDEFTKVNDKYSLISLFYTLIAFKDPRINNRIETYFNDKDYLIAFNSRRALGHDTKELIEKERLKNKR